MFPVVNMNLKKSYNCSVDWNHLASLLIKRRNHLKFRKTDLSHLLMLKKYLISVNLKTYCKGL